MPHDRPNLILITTDQQRFDTLGVAGNPAILTPHLNWMADTGVLFRNAYTDAPICCAARATLLTGLHYRNMGPCGNWGQPSAADRARTLPALLTRSGYQTRLVGKAHFDPPRCNYGFEHMEILEDYYRFVRRFPERGIPMDHGIGQNELEPVISTVDESWSLTRWTVDRATDFIETRDRTRPFFLQVGFAKPHPPLDPCLNYWQLYANQPVPEPVTGDWSAEPEALPPGFVATTRVLSGADRLSPQVLQQARRAYYACITQIDYNLGAFFARLRELNLLDNTLVVFASDHGEMLGDHHLAGKTVFLEGSAHVPMLVRGPAELIPLERVGTRSDALVCLADIVPTFLNAAGAAPQDGPALDGIDLLDVLSGRRAPRDAFIGAYGDQFCVLRDGWKYLYTTAGGAELLFDLSTDAMEQRNLAAMPEHRSRRDRLRGELISALKASGSAAVAGDDLVTRPAPEARKARAGRWPGFHTRENTPTDVLH